MNFKAPDNYQELYDEVVAKCYALIKLKYWDKIQKSNLDQWLRNFSSPEEKYLATLILNKIIYRNFASIMSAMSQLFYVNLPELLSKYNIYTVPTYLHDWEKLLKKETFSQQTTFAFSTITTGELGESSAFYARLLREYFLHKNLLKTIQENLPERISTLIFIDDIIGSGDQVNEFIKDNRLVLQKYKNIFFMPLMAHEVGIKNIQRNIKLFNLEHIIHIIPIETLTLENSFFHFKKNAFSSIETFDGVNSIDDLRIFYKFIVDTKKVVDSTNLVFGFGNLALSLLFHTGVPDNTIPLIYRSVENSWASLQEKF